MGSKAFKNLQAKWYRKLEDDGFEDIEATEEELLAYDNNRFKDPSKYSGFNDFIPEQYEEKRKYFEQAQKLLAEDPFLDEIEKRIWSLHSDGKPIRSIVLVLRSEGIDRNKNQVNQIINELQGLMFK